MDLNLELDLLEQCPRCYGAKVQLLHNNLPCKYCNGSGLRPTRVGYDLLTLLKHFTNINVNIPE